MVQRRIAAATGRTPTGRLVGSFGTSSRLRRARHHVSIYLGSEVINAYQSGDHIEKKPLSVFNDFPGAVQTRALGG
jgi:hypothetical protein